MTLDWGLVEFGLIAVASVIGWLLPKILTVTATLADMNRRVKHLEDSQREDKVTRKEIFAELKEIRRAVARMEGIVCGRKDAKREADA